MKVLSLCNGTQERFKAPYPKQLCSILGTPLLRFTYEQAKRYVGYEMWTVTHNKALIDFCERHGMRYIVVPPTEKLVETINLTREFWDGDRTVFLMGDVYYSLDAIQKIFTEQCDIRFFGSDYELYSMTVSSKWYGELVNRLPIVTEQSRGKMWHLFRCVMGLKPPYERHLPSQFIHHPTYCAINDITDDMDTVEQYNKLIRLLNIR